MRNRPTRGRARLALGLLLATPPVLYFVFGPSAESRRFFTANVVAVADGDTVTVLRTTDGGTGRVKVRLNEIDAPELDQPHGRSAKAALSKLVFGKTVTVEPDGTDRYGRTIAHLHVGDVHVNRRLVREGHAWAYRKYLEDRTLLDDEQAAREAERGLWAAEKSQAPWEWRAAGRDEAGRAGVARTVVEPTGPLRIVALLPNPTGPDEGHESVTLANVGDSAVSLDGWRLVDEAGHDYPLAGSIEATGEWRIVMTEPERPMPLTTTATSCGCTLRVGRNRRTSCGTTRRSRARCCGSWSKFG